MRRTKNLLWIWFIITLLVSIGTVGISVSADTTVLSAPTIIDETLTPQPTTTIRPTADGLNTAWTGSYADWDEATQNGDTDYVSATTLMLTESSELEDPAHQPWDIARVRVIAYARNTDPTSDEELVFILVIGGMTYWADYPAWPKPGYTLTTSYEEYMWEWGKNPATGDYWTWSDIDALEAGVESKASADYVWTGEIRVTQLYVEVEGPRLTVDIEVSNVEDLWGYSFILDYNTTILTATSYTSYDPYTYAWPSEINDTAGYVSVTYSKPTGQPGESGNMTLMQLAFLVEGLGETDLDLHSTKLSDRAAAYISHIPVDGYFSNSPPTTHTLVVDSSPISGIEFTVDGTDHTTPWSDSLPEETYTVVMPSTWGIYNFDHWEDTSTNPSRTISLTDDTTITAYYVKRQWTLTVNSDPIDGVDFTLDGVAYTTPWSSLLDEGSYTVIMPSTWTVDTDVYSFDHWEDASIDPTRVISLTSDVSITAYYELAPKYWTLTVDSDPITGVEFTLDDVSQTTPYSASLTEGSHTIVMPSTWGIYDFDHWEDDSTDPTRTVSLTTDTTVTAYFVARQWTLTVNSDPIAGIDFTINGAVQTTPWSSLLDEGSYTVVMPLTWTTGTGDVYQFDHWDDTSSDPTRTISLTYDTIVTAYYEYVPETHELTVISDPITGVEFTIDGSIQYTPWSGDLAEGSHTVVMPSTWGIYDFDRWEDTSTNPTRVIDLTSDVSVTAYYVKRQWTLTVNSDPISGIDFTVDGVTHTTSWSGLLDEGDHTIVMPSSFDIYNFDHWEDDSTDPTRTISLTEDTTVTATYEIYVPPLGWIEGTVTDAQNALPIEGVTVTADGYSANTNASGYYKIEVPAPATYDVTAEVANYFSGIVTEVFVDVEATARVDFALTPMKHDVAVTGVSVVSEAVQGDVVTINVDVANLGDYYEIFDVSVTYATTPIETKSVALTSGDSTTVSFDWDTLVVAPDTYDITSEAVLAGDVDPTNNMATATIIIKPTPMHDIAVTSVVPSSLEVAVGGSVDIDVTIENQGTAEDSFTINVYAGVDLVGSTISTLSAGASHTFTFTWTTTVEGDFLIKAEIPPIPGEEDLADNILEDGTVTVTAAPSILVAAVEINPETLNLRSNGRWITCYVQLPEGFNAEDIDVSTIRLEDVIPAEWAVVENSVLVAKFDRAAVINHIRDVLGTTNGKVTLTVTGKLVGGTTFEGSDTIIVISRGKGAR